MCNKIAVLGCTGSIGTTGLRVADSMGLEVGLLVNGSDLNGLKKLIEQYTPKTAVCVEKKYLYENGREYTLPPDFLNRSETYSEYRLTLNGIVGLSGLLPGLAVLKSGAKLATANKESFVCAGKFMAEYGKTGDNIYPVDSEHSAAWRLLRHCNNPEKIFLTASGGAFRDRNITELEDATAVDALAHPTWKMGKKVTLDCATLMNKGMEIIEAKHLFGLPVGVLMHRESFVHALVRTTDGALLSDMSSPDMAHPIAYAFNYDRQNSFRNHSTAQNFYQYAKTDFATNNFLGDTYAEADINQPKTDRNRFRSEFRPEEDLLSQGALHFSEPDRKKFPCLAIAERVSLMGDCAACVMNASNDLAVDAFRDNIIKFYDIPRIIDKSLDKFAVFGDFSNTDEVFSMVKAVHEYTLRCIRQIAEER